MEGRRQSKWPRSQSPPETLGTGTRHENVPEEPVRSLASLIRSIEAHAEGPISGDRTGARGPPRSRGHAGRGDACLGTVRGPGSERRGAPLRDSGALVTCNRASDAGAGAKGLRHRCLAQSGTLHSGRSFRAGQASAEAGGRGPVVSRSPGGAFPGISSGHGAVAGGRTSGVSKRKERGDRHVGGVRHGSGDRPCRGGAGAPAGPLDSGDVARDRDPSFQLRLRGYDLRP